METFPLIDQCMISFVTSLVGIHGYTRPTLQGGIVCLIKNYGMQSKKYTLGNGGTILILQDGKSTVIKSNLNVTITFGI